MMLLLQAVGLATIPFVIGGGVVGLVHWACETRHPALFFGVLCALFFMLLTVAAYLSLGGHL